MRSTLGSARSEENQPVAHASVSGPPGKSEARSRNCMRDVIPSSGNGLCRCVLTIQVRGTGRYASPHQSPGDVSAARRAVSSNGRVGAAHCRVRG
jgi:hypothetical protein